MKLTAKLLRTTTIPTAELIAVAGFDPKTTEMPSSKLEAALRERFSPFAPRFEIYLPPEMTTLKTVVGIEALSFDVLEPNLPQAGLVMVDPMNAQDVDRLDGALESELNRMGLGTDFQGMEWRMSYRTKGN